MYKAQHRCVDDDVIGSAVLCVKREIENRVKILIRDRNDNASLAAYGFTNRADYVDRMVECIEAGNVSINTLEASLPETPSGGVKSSGYGSESGTEGLHHYMITKNVSHSMSIV